MPERNSDIVWSDRRTLLQNQSRNTKPFFVNSAVENESLVPTQRKGESLYVYDFGGVGQIGDLIWDGDGFVSFRYKVADTREELDQTEFVGSYTDRFQAQVIDASQWETLPGPYLVVQDNGLRISGATPDDTTIYQEQGLLQSQNEIEFPGALEARMRLVKVGNSSGSKVFIGVTDGTNTVVVQKIYEKLKASVAREGQTTNTNVGNIATAVVTRNGTIIFTDDNAQKLTDGILEKIDFEGIPTVAIDTLVNLKRYANIPQLDGDPQAFGVTAEAIPFRVRADYNPTQASGALNQYVHYDIVRDAGFYRATMPIVNRKLDLYEAQVESFNWNPQTKEYEQADANNIWKIAITLPPGVHRYLFLVDNTEQIDLSNPESYYLDENNNKVSVFADGYGYDNGIFIPEGAPFFSELVVVETQTIEFLFQGYADTVSLIGTFNDYNPTVHKMAETVDRQVIRRLADPNFVYINSNVDYHKIEITLPYRMSVDTIDFATLIPRAHKQRVKMYLDNIPVSRHDWNIVPRPVSTQEFIEGGGTGTLEQICMAYGYGYGVPISGYGVHYGYGTGYGIDYGYGHSTGYGGTVSGYGSGLEISCVLSEEASCDILAANSSTFSYWDNNTDTITAAEDVVVRWCLKDGLTRTAQKITFLSRIEASLSKMRKHLSLDFYGSDEQAHTVTDYAFSDSYALVQETHTTYGNPFQQWVFPIANLHPGVNELLPATYDNEGNPIFGDPVTVQVEDAKPSAWELNRSGWAAHSLEVIYGIAGKLRAPPLKMFSIIDDRSLNTVEVEQPEERFVDINVTRRVFLANVEVKPNIELAVKMVGLANTFELQFYDSVEDAQAEQNLRGTVVAATYGEMFPGDFTGEAVPDGTANFFLLDKTIATQCTGGVETPVTVGNIVATFEQGGGDKIVLIGQVR